MGIIRLTEVGTLVTRTEARISLEDANPSTNQQ